MNAVVQQIPKNSLVTRMAERFGVDADKMLTTLKATAFKTGQNKPEVTNEQMMALLVVSEQYKLNPWTKEIYAFPDSKNGIVPVVGVDGWSRIINERPELDGIDFRYSEETVEHKAKKCHIWVECVIYRKDRSHATVVREYFTEVVRKLDYGCPWDTHPNRMHRHKALIQCARIAFGFGGIYDQDEAERIIEATPTGTIVNPRGDLTGITDEMCEPYVQTIADIINDDKEEHERAQMLRDHDIEMSRFPEVAIRVSDLLAKRGICKKQAYKDWLKIGIDRGETHA